MRVTDESPREAELAALLNGALVGCPSFKNVILSRIGAHQPDVLDGIRVRVEYSPGDSNKRFDLFLSREDPALSVAFELKRDEIGLHEEQIREYLALLGLIQDDRSLRRRRNSSKYALLVVITGATEKPLILNDICSAGKGFLKPHVKWMSWYELMDIIENLPGDDHDNPLVKQLANCLSEQGYVSYKDALPRLRQQEKLLGRILEISELSDTEDDMLVLDATLGRVEYQMAKMDYGVTVHITIRARKKSISRHRAVKLGKPISIFGTNLKSIGRSFLPNSDIREFEKKTKVTRGQKTGVGIAYSVHERSWVAYIVPEKDKPLPEKFIAEYATRNRIPMDFNSIGIHGWVLKGKDKQPEKAARFLTGIWQCYASNCTK